MTYMQLRDFLNTLHHDSLSDHVTIRINDCEYFKCNAMGLVGEGDVLYDGHIYINVDQRGWDDRQNDLEAFDMIGNGSFVPNKVYGS